VPGLDENFDRANNRVEKIKKQIEDYIEIPRKDFKNKGITYTTGSTRFRYEIEVPDELVKKVPDTYVNTSNAKGRKRY
jgi:DNA mismatch repair ATPase MutS